MGKIGALLTNFMGLAAVWPILLNYFSGPRSWQNTMRKFQLAVAKRMGLVIAGAFSYPALAPPGRRKNKQQAYKNRANFMILGRYQKPVNTVEATPTPKMPKGSEQIEHTPSSTGKVRRLDSQCLETSQNFGFLKNLAVWGAS